MKNLFLAAATAVTLCGAMSATAQTPGVLIVNEFSKGAGNVGSYVELLVGTSTISSGPNVDIRNWIIDDNNGTLSGTGGTGKGISTGHLRLTDDAFWSNVPAGTLVVLFDAANLPTTTTMPGYNSIITAAANSGADYTLTVTTPNRAIYVAVGLSSLVSYKSNLPITSNSGYCGGNAYIAPGLWSSIALASEATGDGIQTRCPGCLTNLQQEPSFFSGASYGSATSHVAAGIGGAHVTTALPTPAFASGKVFSFFQGTAGNAAGVDANWKLDTATAATQTPGVANTVANGTFIANVAAASEDYRYTACAQPDPMTEPKGVLVVTEISNGPSSGTASGECEYVVLAVAPCSASSAAAFVDVRGWVLDDNNGIFNPSGAGSGKGITTGHFRLAYDTMWSHVPVGSSIVVFNQSDNCYNLPVNQLNGAVGGVYFQPVGGTVAAPFNNPHIERYASFPSTSNDGYCNPNGLNTPYTNPAAAYSSTVGLGNTGDGFQVRCPGCTDINNANPVFYHGIGYGTATGANAFSSFSTTGLDGTVINFSSIFTTGSNNRIVFNASSAVTSSTDLNNAANYTVDTAFVAGTPGTIGSYDPALFNYIVSEDVDFPCCGSFSALKTVKTAGMKIIGQDNGVKVYPNPAKGVLNIEFAAAPEVSVKVIDINGRTVAEQNVNGKSKVSFDVTAYTPGLYFYQVITNGNIQSGKVTIAK